MPSPYIQSLLCPVLIGRDAQVAALARLLDQARAGHGQIALISGEAGIGKSRLITEIKRQVQQMGGQIGAGFCFELDSTYLYAPILDLLRNAAFAAPLADEVRTLLTEPPRNLEDPEQYRRRLFDTLANTLLNRHSSHATRHPLLLLIFEDLHWADDATLEFLGFLTRHIVEYPLLLLLTYRSDEITPALMHLLAQLDRRRLATEIALPPLTERETDQMVRTLFQQNKPIRSDFLYTIHSLSEGNPFFIEEMLKALVAAGDIFQSGGGWERKPLAQLHIPRTVQAAVQSRIADVSTGARRLLQLAAVMGRQFDFGVLQQITGMDEAIQIGLIKELIETQLVSETTANIFTFRHALTRQAIYNELLQRERSALHQLVGEAIEQHTWGATHTTDAGGEAAVSASLAYHFYEAQQWEKALHYAQMAGEQARRADAPRAAIVHYTRAIEAAHSVYPHQGHHALYHARGQAAERIGDFDQARFDYETALAAARTVQAHHAEWQNLLALGFLWTARSYAQADGYFQTALVLARAHDEPVALARTLNRVGNWYLNADAPQTALTHHAEALALLRQTNDQAGIAETLDLVGTATYYSGDLTRAKAIYQETIGLCRKLEQRTTLVSALLLAAVVDAPNYLHDTLPWPTRENETSDDTGAEALALCTTMQWRLREAFVLAYLAWRDGSRGAYTQAFTHARRALLLADESEFHLVAAHLAFALLYLDIGAFDAAQQAIATTQHLAKQVGALMIRRFVDATQARILIAQGQYAEAESLLHSACPPTTPMETPPQRLLWLAWLEWRLATGDPAGAFAVIEKLRATVPLTEAANAIPALWLPAGEALLALRRYTQAEEQLQRARTVAATYEALPLLWRIDATLANLYRSQRRSDAAEAMTTAVHVTITQLIAQLPEESLRDALRGHAASCLPAPKRPTPRQRAKRAVDGLTAREVEVATLAAQGLTNLEIATALSVTERTVESHISNILAKLGYTNRTQIATWAASKGLTLTG
ncbi:MAG: AAA family ATPase [Caldilineaceae bacterium]